MSRAHNRLSFQEQPTVTKVCQRSVTVGLQFLSLTEFSSQHTGTSTRRKTDPVGHYTDQQSLTPEFCCFPAKSVSTAIFSVRKTAAATATNALRASACRSRHAKSLDFPMPSGWRTRRLVGELQTWSRQPIGAPARCAHKSANRKRPPTFGAVPTYAEQLLFCRFDDNPSATAP